MKHNRRYTDEFKLEVLEMAASGERSINQLARVLGQLTFPRAGHRRHSIKVGTQQSTAEGRFQRHSSDYPL